MEKSSLWEFNWVITSSQNFLTYTALSTTNFVTLFLSKIFHEKTIFFFKIVIFSIWSSSYFHNMLETRSLYHVYIFSFQDIISNDYSSGYCFALFSIPFWIVCVLLFKFGNIWKKQLWMCSIKKEVLQIFSKFLAKHLGISVRISF